MAYKLPYHAKGPLFWAHYLKKSSKHTKSILSFLMLLRKQIDENRYTASLMLIFSVE